MAERVLEGVGKQSWQKAPFLASRNTQMDRGEDGRQLPSMVDGATAPLEREPYTLNLPLLFSLLETPSSIK